MPRIQGRKTLLQPFPTNAFTPNRLTKYLQKYEEVIRDSIGSDTGDRGNFVGTSDLAVLAIHELGLRGRAAKSLKSRTGQIHYRDVLRFHRADDQHTAPDAEPPR